MDSIINRKQSLVSSYANTIFSLFKKTRYGIQCGSMSDLLLKKALKDVVQWQDKLEGDISNMVEITLISDLPQLSPTTAFTIGGLQQRNTTKVQLKYILNQNTEVIIDSDGCQTDVTIIPGSDDYMFTQDTPSTIWIIQHNLGFHPNVRIEDFAGANMHGVIADDPSNPGNRLTITFSLPVSGKAYLS